MLCLLLDILSHKDCSVVLLTTLSFKRTNCLREWTEQNHFLTWFVLFSVQLSSAARIQARIGTAMWSVNHSRIRWQWHMIRSFTACCFVTCGRLCPQTFSGHTTASGLSQELNHDWLGVRLCTAKHWTICFLGFLGSAFFLTNLFNELILVMHYSPKNCILYFFFDYF